MRQGAVRLVTRTINDLYYVVAVTDTDNVLSGLEATYDQDAPIDGVSATFFHVQPQAGAAGQTGCSEARGLEFGRDHRRRQRRRPVERRVGGLGG